MPSRPVPQVPDPGGELIDVPKVMRKLALFFEYAKANPGRSFPETQAELVKRIVDDKIHVTEQQISKTKNLTGKLKLCVHRAIIGKFGLPWPCPEYYDDQDIGPRKDEELLNLERRLFPARHIIRLAPIISNKGDFLDPDLFVLKLDSVGTGREFNGALIGKPASKVLEGEEGTWTGRRLGIYGLTSFTVCIIPDDGVTVSTTPCDPGDKISETISIRDMSTNLQHRWKIERQNYEGAEPLNENIEVARVSISEMPPGTKIRIQAYAPGPTLFLTLPHSVLQKSKLDERTLERKIKQVLLTKMKLQFGDLPHPSEENVILGEIYFKSSTPKAGS